MRFRLCLEPEVLVDSVGVESTLRNPRLAHNRISERERMKIERPVRYRETPESGALSGRKQESPVEARIHACEDKIEVFIEELDEFPDQFRLGQEDGIDTGRIGATIDRLDLRIVFGTFPHGALHLEFLGMLLTSEPDGPQFDDAVPLRIGPGRLDINDEDGRQGEFVFFSWFAFHTC